MIGPARPMRHAPHHDLESIFYVLLGISVFYDEPYKPKTEDELSECFDIYFNTHHPSLQKIFTIQSELSWLSSICEHFSDYFKPLCPLFDILREKIVLPMTYVDGAFRLCEANPITHDEMVKYLIDMLYNLPDEAWVTKECPPSGEGGGDTLGSPLGLPLANHVYNLPHSDSYLDDSWAETPESERICHSIAIHPTGGPGFTTSSTSSNSTRRPHSGSDEDYVDLSHSVKRPRFNVDTTIANHTNPWRSTASWFAATALAALPWDRQDL